MKTLSGEPARPLSQPISFKQEKGNDEQPSRISLPGLLFAFLLSIGLFALLWWFGIWTNHTLVAETVQQAHFSLLNMVFTNLALSNYNLSLFGIIAVATSLIPVWILAEQRLGRSMAIWILLSLLLQPLFWQVASARFSPNMLLLLPVGFYLVAVENKKLTLATILLIVMLAVDESGWWLAGILAGTFALTEKKLVYWIQAAFVLILIVTWWYWLAPQNPNLFSSLHPGTHSSNPLNLVLQTLSHPLYTIRVILHPVNVYILSLFFIPFLFLPLFNARFVIIFILWMIPIALYPNTALEPSLFLPGIILTSWAFIHTLDHIKKRIWSYRGFGVANHWWGIPLLITALILWFTVVLLPILWSSSY